MEKKLIALVFVALLGGLGGGYGLGYVIYQPQMLGLQSEVSSLNADHNTFQNQLANCENQINWLNTSYHDLNSKYSALNSSYIELMNTILLYESPIEITSVNVTATPLLTYDSIEIQFNYTVKNNGQRMEYLIGHLFFYDTDGERIGSISSSGFSKFIFPSKEVTIEGIHYYLPADYEAFVIEIWTYDGDMATAYVEVP